VLLLDDAEDLALIPQLLSLGVPMNASLHETVQENDIRMK
jgi:hypothetical protein